MEVGGSKPLAPTTPGREARARRRYLILIVLAVALLLAWAAWSAATVLAAGRDADAGRAIIERARDRSSLGDIVEGRPLPDLKTAGARFRRAHSRIRSPLLAPARILPIIGRQIRSADALTGAATTVTDIAIAAIEEGRRILRAARRTGPERVSLLRRTAALARDAERRIGKASLGPDRGLIGSLGRARRELGREISELRDTLRTAAVAAGAGADLLAGPRRTLVFAANNAEMRAGSGMFLSLGELATSGGRIALGRMQSVASVPIPRGVPVTGDMAARWGWANPSRDWTSLMMSPDFEASASLAARMWKAARGVNVDGVISIDPAGFRALLKATGAVTVDGRRIDASNVMEYLLHDQYERFPTVASGAARREDLGNIAEAVVTQLNAGRWAPAELMSGLAEAAGGRHIMLWSARSAEQAAWIATGAGGRPSSSSLLVSVLNRGGNKLDWFTRVNADLSFEPTAAGTEAVLRVTIRNAVPAGEPVYVAGPNPESGAKAGEYVGILAVTLPGASGGGRIDGIRLGVAGKDGPTRVVGALFTLPRGRTRTFVVRFELSVRSGAIRVEPSSRIPPIEWRYGAERWEDEEPHSVFWGKKES